MLDTYGRLQKTIKWSLALIFILLLVAAIDSFYFSEAYRPVISFFGKIALIIFSTGCFLAFIKGVSDKVKQNKRFK